MDRNTVVVLIKYANLNVFWFFLAHLSRQAHKVSL